jgi:predicted RNase H-like HicB family nuclease
MQRFTYPAIFHTAKDGISIEFPDLPGCLPCAHSLQEAKKNAAEALTVHLSGMIKDGDPIPEPSPVEAIKLGPGETVHLINTIF